MVMGPGCFKTRCSVLIWNTVKPVLTATKSATEIRQIANEKNTKDGRHNLLIIHAHVWLPVLGLHDTQRDLHGENEDSVPLKFLIAASVYTARNHYNISVWFKPALTDSDV